MIAAELLARIPGEKTRVLVSEVHAGRVGVMAAVKTLGMVDTPKVERTSYLIHRNDPKIRDLCS